MGFVPSWKVGVAGCVLVAALGLGLYVNDLRSTNAELTDSLNTLKNAYDAQVSATQSCSDSVKDLSEKSILQTENAQKAVSEAKDKAKAEYDKAYALLISKPKPPVITPENAVNYGGINKDSQLQDYVNTHALFNEQFRKKDE